MTTMTKPLAVTVTLRGNVGPGAARYARTKIATVLEEIREPVLDAHVVLDWHRDPARKRPALAEVGVDVNGTMIRAMSVRPTMQEAVDELEERLRRRIRRLENRERARHRHAPSGEHQWRHGDPPRPTYAHFARPVDEREIVRHKAHPDIELSSEEAIYEMEMLDHDFYLFRDAETGSPAVLRRVEPHSYAVDALPPSLTEAQARARLDASGEPMVFYIDAESGEARVLYLRYDGHYGSIALVRT